MCDTTEPLENPSQNKFCFLERANSHAQNAFFFIAKALLGTPQCIGKAVSIGCKDIFVIPSLAK